MQSPLGKSKRSTRRAQALAWTHSVEGRSSVREQAALISPVERQIEFDETRRGELDRLPAVQDRVDQLGAEKGEVDEAPDITTRDTIALGQFPQRSGASRGKLLEPRSSARDRLDKRGVASRGAVLYCHCRQHQPHFDTAAPQGHRRCKLDWAVARSLSSSSRRRWFGICVRNTAGTPNTPGSPSNASARPSHAPSNSPRLCGLMTSFTALIM